MVTQGYPSDHLMRFVATTLPDPSQPIVGLELGCGSGANLLYFGVMRRKDVWHGIEIDPAVAEHARGRLGDLASVSTGDMSSLPFDAEKFDFVIDIEAIYQNDWPAIQKIAREIYRVLKPGGWFFGQMMASAWHVSREDWRDGHRFSKDEIAELFVDFDLKSPIDYAERSVDCQRGIIKEWLVKARKPA